jgi:hypothetical protein
MKEKEITIIVVEPGKQPEVTKIKNELKPMQEIVGGYIETVGLGGNIILICNEEGLLMNLPANRKVAGNSIVGTFFITKADGEDFTSLTKTEINIIMQLIE